MQILSLSQKGYFILYNENKNAFCFEKGAFYWASKSAIAVEKGVFFVQNPRKGVLFRKLGYEHGIGFGQEGGGGKRLGYCELLHWKIQGQDHGWIQRSKSHSWPSTQPT